MAKMGYVRTFRYAFWTLGIALGLSLLALVPVQAFTDLSWWRIFRRCVSIGAVLALILSLKRDEASPRAIGFVHWSEGRRNFRLGVILGGAVLALMLAAGLLFDACAISIHPDRAKLWRTVIGFIPAAVLVAFIEEGVFRGYLLRELQRHSTALAVGATSAVYALVHLRTWDMTAMVAQELIGLAILGAVLCLATLRSGNLYLAIGLHAVLAYGARVNKLIVEIPESSLTWWVGTSRLVNGMAGWTALLATAWIIHVWVGRARHNKPMEGTQ